MSHSHSATNGASLEDCHANFFALTDVCGIKWAVFREDASQLAVPGDQVQCREDPVLSSYSRCLEAELLAVWRRVPKKALVTYTYDMSGNEIPQPPQNAGDSKNILSQRKELWVFWYGERPDDTFQSLVSCKLKEVRDISGTWENGLPYEARTLLFKALNNLIERNLVSKDFVRLGKWFVQPFDGPSPSPQTSSHLSFTFHYFIHGESSVCASVDVRQHPPVRRLSLRHLTLARGQAAPVHVILAPHGLAATLTGATSSSAALSNKEWSTFFPLRRERYFCRNAHDELVAMPTAVEVMVAGVKMIYPTCYVLVTDMDQDLTTPAAGAEGGEAANKTLETCNSSSGTRLGSPQFQVEPSPFTASNHPLLVAHVSSPNLDEGNRRVEFVWQDALCTNPEAAQQQAANEEQQPGGGSQILEYLSHWDFCNPARLGKKRAGGRRQKDSSSRSSKDPRNRFSSRVPFHKKVDVVDDLSWQLDHTHIVCSGSGNGTQAASATNGSARQDRIPGNVQPSGSVNPGSMGPPGSVKTERDGGGGAINSPASLGTPVSVMTPKAPAPGSVRTPGDSLMSPSCVGGGGAGAAANGAPLSNGPLTPIGETEPQRTPKSVPHFSVASPYMNVKEKKAEVQPPVKPDNVTENSASKIPSFSVFSSLKRDSPDTEPPPIPVRLPVKRPSLPTKEYEDELKREDFLSDQIYDYQALHHWLNHPVKRFRGERGRLDGGYSGEEPLRPIYRRNSQAEVFTEEDLRRDVRVKEESGHELSFVGPQQLNSETDRVKQSVDPAVNGGFNQDDPYEFSDAVGGEKKDGDKKPDEDTDLFSTQGLKPSMTDLDNLFDDSSDETEAPTGEAPTPPDSNKPAGLHEDEEKTGSCSIAGNTTNGVKMSTGGVSLSAGTCQKKVDPAGNLPHDQLAKMFPTPPSNDHHQIKSPAENVMEHEGCFSAEPLSLSSLTGDVMMDWNSSEDQSAFMLASSIFAPLPRLYSDEFPQLHLGEEVQYKARPPKSRQHARNSNQSSHQQQQHSGPGSVPTPLGTPSGSQHKPGMSPISPMTGQDGGPRSHHGPGSNYGHDVASPASASSSFNKSTGAANSNATSLASSDFKASPEANALLLNLVLCDTLINVFRDHNFDSCTLCVCGNNDGNVRGRDAALYLPQVNTTNNDDEEYNCNCGFSAVVNRRLAYQSGLFYEDETEVTGIAEDLYFRKKASLLLLDPKANVHEQGFAEKSAEVDGVSRHLIKLIHKQSGETLLAEQSGLLRCAKQHFRSSRNNSEDVSMVELLDGNHVVFTALNQVKAVSSPEASSKASSSEDSTRASCLHKWSLVPAPGPFCSEDLVRVMKALQPLLNSSLHASKVNNSNSSVQGPLTWRQFHRMAGPATKGNTDDQCEPLPVPSVTLGHERDLVSLSPLALRFWQPLGLEPYGQRRDVVYVVVAPENDFLMASVKTFFRNLSNAYELCRLGKHVPYCKMVRDGILRVGKMAANKLSNGESERWFDLIGDFPTAALLKLYSQVCRQYLLPMLLDMNLDRNLLDPNSSQKSSLVDSKPPQSPSMMNSDAGVVGSGSLGLACGFGGGLDDQSNKENSFHPSSSTASASSVDVDDPDNGDPPALVIYLLDPFSFGVDNCDLARLSSLALLKCFHQILPLLPESLRHHVCLHTISLESVFELSSPHAPEHSRGLALSVYSSARRPLMYGKDCKSLTGFGPASNAERFLRTRKHKMTQPSYLHQPAFVLSPPPTRKKIDDSLSDRSTTLFVNYFLTEDQHWLLAAASDERGELVETSVINVDIPNKTRRKKASARRVGLKKLMDWVLSVMAMALVPWRLVIGRVGRIGHGELRGWSVLLGRSSLQRASQHLRKVCSWPSDVPTIISACLVSLEPDSNLRLLADQFTPDERFGQTASNCQLSTPKDASCTHILVFPTSATAQSSQKAFEEHQDSASANDLLDLDIGTDNDGLDGLDGLGDFKDIFDTTDWSGGVEGDAGAGSPGSPNKRNSASRPNSPGQSGTGGGGGSGGGGSGSGGGDTFKYGQEEPGDRLEFLQQPLALGYLVSTAKTGHMPRWFWAGCPHLEHVCPVFLKSALHINQVVSGGEDGFPPQAVASGGRIHSLDSTYTTDVLRYVLEGYNALSWLSLDPVTHDRHSCLPIHVQILQQMYNTFSAIV